MDRLTTDRRKSRKPEKCKLRLENQGRIKNPIPLVVKVVKRQTNALPSYLRARTANNEQSLYIKRGTHQRRAALNFLFVYSRCKYSTEVLKKFCVDFGQRGCDDINFHDLTTLEGKLLMHRNSNFAISITKSLVCIGTEKSPRGGTSRPAIDLLCKFR